MNVMFLVKGRWFKTLCKTVLDADTFDVSISTEKHIILARVSDKCYFKSIDNYCLGNDTSDIIKTDFFISKNFKNTNEFLSELEDTLITFLKTSIIDKEFCGNIDEYIEQCLEGIKIQQKNPRQRQRRKPITTDIDMIKDFTKETPTSHAKSLLNSAYGITVERETAENDTAYKMSDIQFESFKCQLNCLAPCDFPPDIVLIQITDEMTENQLQDYCKILLDKGLANYHRGEIVTSKKGYTLYTPTHKYEIKVFKDGVFIRSLTFSLESLAEYAFEIMELNSIDFPKPCFKTIVLFKDGKAVKRSIIHFGEKKFNDQTSEKWVIINKNTIHDIMKTFKIVQGKCEERIVVNFVDLYYILDDIFKTLMDNGLLGDKKIKRIHYDFGHNFPTDDISFPKSTHFDIIYKQGFFFIDLNSIKRDYCPNRKHGWNFIIEV